MNIGFHDQANVLQFTAVVVYCLGTCWGGIEGGPLLIAKCAQLFISQEQMHFKILFADFSHHFWAKL